MPCEDQVCVDIVHDSGELKQLWNQHLYWLVVAAVSDAAVAAGSHCHVSGVAWNSNLNGGVFASGCSVSATVG